MEVEKGVDEGGGTGGQALSCRSLVGVPLSHRDEHVTTHQSS